MIVSSVTLAGSDDNTGPQQSGLSMSCEFLHLYISIVLDDDKLSAIEHKIDRILCRGQWTRCDIEELVRLVMYCSAASNNVCGAGSVGG